MLFLSETRMNNKKQIEEMTKDIDTIMKRRCFNNLCDNCEFDCQEACEEKMLATALINDYDYRKASDVVKIEEKLADVTANWQKIHDAYDTDCIKHYNKGRSEVAREIFEEIDRMCIDTFGNFNHRVFAELKKKYTEINL